MQYKHFKRAIESEYKNSLNNILHEICIIEKLNAVEGAKKIGIAKEVFVYWRHYYRFEERQISFDQAVEDLKNRPALYDGEIKSIIEWSNSVT